MCVCMCVWEGEEEEEDEEWEVSLLLVDVFLLIKECVLWIPTSGLDLSKWRCWLLSIGPELNWSICNWNIVVLILNDWMLLVCRYTKGAWSECDAATNQRTRSLSLKKGDTATCQPSKTITKKCKKGRVK